ncbi:hypothetical protein EDB85DRAFT_1890395 [Lactarius pseudohatsudake]|nr:hypothetical protein EDB85DRAFT_1890395 [Lactarius pseudohatsudake]
MVSAGGSEMSTRQQEHEEQEANAIGAAKRETGGGREHEQNLRQRARAFAGLLTSHRGAHKLGNCRSKIAKGVRECETLGARGSRVLGVLTNVNVDVESLHTGVSIFRIVRISNLERAPEERTMAITKCASHPWFSDRAMCHANRLILKGSPPSHEDHRRAQTKAQTQGQEAEPFRRTNASPRIFVSILCVSKIGPDDDDDCLSVQLDGSDMSPKAPKTILRQRFTMRRYNLGKDGRLTKPGEGYGCHHDNAVDRSYSTTTHVIPIPTRRLHAVASLMATNFRWQKQAIIPALLGMAKFTEMHTQARSVTQPQAVIEPPSSNSGVASATSSGGAHAGYQMYQRPFSSSSGSGYTIWYSSRSDSSIQSPPVISQSKTGHLYVHFDALTKTYQYWMLGVGGQRESVSRNVECPLNHDRVLSIRGNGEPSWVTRATISTSETRREKGAKS